MISQKTNITFAFLFASIMLFAYIINFFINFSHSFWMLVATFVTLVTLERKPPRHAFLCFITMMAALFFSHLLYRHLQASLSAFIIASTYIAIITLRYWHRPAKSLINLPLLFGLTLILTIFIPNVLQSQLIEQVIDVFIGCFIALIGSLIVYTSFGSLHFRKSLLPMLIGLIDSVEKMIQYLENTNKDLHEIIKKTYSKQEHLMLDRSSYPEWVFETGFNPGLRAGQRFFLLNIETIADIIASLEMNCMQYDRNHKEIDQHFVAALKTNKQLLQVIKDFCLSETYILPKHDFKQDIQALQEFLQKKLPANLESLTHHKDALVCVAIARSIKDMRETLFALVMALPNANVSSR